MWVTDWSVIHLCLQQLTVSTDGESTTSTGGDDDDEHGVELNGDILEAESEDLVVVEDVIDEMGESEGRRRGRWD